MADTGNTATIAFATTSGFTPAVLTIDLPEELREKIRYGPLDNQSKDRRPGRFARSWRNSRYDLLGSERKHISADWRCGGIDHNHIPPEVWRRNGSDVCRDWLPDSLEGPNGPERRTDARRVHDRLGWQNRDSLYGGQCVTTRSRAG